MLDIVDAVVDRFHGPLLLLCLARPELLDRRPTWAAGKPRTVTTDVFPHSDPWTPGGCAGALLGGCARIRHRPRVRDRRGQSALPRTTHGDALWTLRGSLVDGRWRGAGEGEIEIPSTIQALLAARIDDLDPSARTILEHASVEGRRFRVAAVRALAGDIVDESLDQSLVSLERGGLIHPEDEAAGRVVVRARTHRRSGVPRHLEGVPSQPS